MEEITQQAIEKGNELLDKTPIQYYKKLSISEKGGLYLFHKEGEGIIYVGEGKILKRRIKDHISAEKRDTLSGLRTKISKKYGIGLGQEIRDWMIKNCRISFIEVENSDLRNLTEMLLIASLRGKEELLNS